MFSGGERIAKLRGRMSQDELSRLAEIGRSTLARYERNKVKDPEYDIIFRLARVLGTTSAYLFGETDDPVEGKISYAEPLSREDWKEIVREVLNEYIPRNGIANHKKETQS